MSKQEVYDNLKIGDLVFFDPKVVRTDWARMWANNKMPVKIINIDNANRKIGFDTRITGICISDKSAGEKRFDANRILDFADELSQIKRDSQRL